MRKLFSLVILMAIFVAGCAKPEPQKSLLEKIEDRGKLVVGVKYDSKPFGFLDENQEVKGFDVDVAREIAKYIFGDENAVEFKQVTSSNRIFMLTSDAVDMVVATMTINPKRRQVVDFSQPYYVAGQAVMVPNTSTIRNVRDLNGKKVIIVLGSTSEKNLRVLAPEAVIQGFRTYNDAYTALKAGRASALTTDDTILYGFVHDDANFKILPERYTKEPYGIAIRKDESAETFKQTVNKALMQLQTNGTLRKLKAKWIKK